MQINANYAAGAEYDINGEGKREWKFLKLKKLRTVQQSTELATSAMLGNAAEALQQQLLWQVVRNPWVKEDDQTV